MQTKRLNERLKLTFIKMDGREILSASTEQGEPEGPWLDSWGDTIV